MNTERAVEPLRYLGRPIPRVDGRAKVTGAAEYVGDLHVPGMLHAAVVRSPVAHGHLGGVDTTAALAVQGVRRVLIAGDLAPLVKVNRYGPVVRDCPLLADDRVRYEGEPVAIVVADTRAAARHGASLVDAAFDELPTIRDVTDALADSAPRLHREASPGEFGGQWSRGWEPQRNIAGQYHDRRGDVDAAFSRAERVFEHTYRVPTIQHYAIENQVALAVPTSDGLTIHAANQYPFLMVKLLADMLDLPESSVRVIVPFVGGAFGGKEYASVLPLAAVAARAVRRPVRLEYTAEESARTVVRHAATMTFRSAVDSEARLVARSVELLFDTGAYADQGPRVVRQAGYRSPGPYRIPNLQVDAYAIYTNKVPAGAYRGFGASQPIYACESHTDEIALELGLDAVEFRRRNLLGLGEDFVAGDLPLDCDIPESLRVAVEEMQRPIQQRAAQPAGVSRLHGVGYAVGVKNTASGHLPSTAIVRVHADGSATVQATSVELGQGTQTMITQVAAEALCVAPERIRVTSPDTAVTPFDQRTSSSRSTVHLGLAVLRAAEDACAIAVHAAARLLDVPPEQLRFEDGTVLGGPEALTIGSLLKDPRAGFGGEIIGVGHFVPEKPDAPTAFGMRAGYWEGSVGAAEVAVDPETGEVELVRYVTVADAGRVINPVTAHGQEEGGAVMAIGHALFEACVFEDGAFLNPSLVDYRLPGIDDVPAALTSRFLERGDGPGPYGSKGLGESSIITVAPAIANAVAAATGTRIRDLPLTAANIWAAGRQEADRVNGRTPDEDPNLAVRAPSE